MAKRFSIPDLSLCPEDVDNWKNGNLMSTPTKGQKKGQTSSSTISVGLCYQQSMALILEAEQTFGSWCMNHLMRLFSDYLSSFQSCCVLCLQACCGCPWCRRCSTSCCWWSASASCVSSSSTPATSLTGSNSTLSLPSSPSCPVSRPSNPCVFMPTSQVDFGLVVL